MNQDPAVNAEVYLLTNADYCIQNAIDPDAHNPMSLTKAMFRIYQPMVSMMSAHPEATQNSLFVQYWGETVSTIYENIVAKALEQNPALDSTDWLRQYYDPHLEPYAKGEKSIPAYLNYLDANRNLLPEAVSAGWDPAGREHHEKHKGDCSADGGCPSESTCGVTEIIQVQQQRGQEAVASLREKYGEIKR